MAITRSDLIEPDLLSLVTVHRWCRTGGMANLLEDKVIVIVGGTTGLGLSAASAMLAAGARGIVVVGRNRDSVREAESLLGSRCRGLAADACDSATASTAIENASRAFGAFDGLYHVAGGSGRKFGDGPLHELTDAGLRATLDLNLSSLIYSNRAAVRWWREQRTRGCILNMGSVLGWSPSPAYFSTHGYAAAKAAIAGFSVSVASYYAKEDIRVNVLAPALVETPMAQRAAKDEAIVAFVRTKQPLAGGRVGLPADCDGAAVFLLSDAAKYITGQVLAVDGGWSVTEGQLPPSVRKKPSAKRITSGLRRAPR
jgi:NAD(P)-dependent dehydrogenase (short-subunit alcohol dehydrogenase family)